MDGDIRCRHSVLSREICDSGNGRMSSNTRCCTHAHTHTHTCTHKHVHSPRPAGSIMQRSGVHPSVCPVGILGATHQGAACDVTGIYLRLAVSRTNILNQTIVTKGCTGRKMLGTTRLRVLWPRAQQSAGRLGGGIRESSPWSRTENQGPDSQKIFFALSFS